MPEPLTPAKILERIREDWTGKPQLSICLSVYDALVDGRLSGRVSYGDLCNVCQVKNSNEATMGAIAVAMQYLCGDRAHLFDAMFEFVDNDFSVGIPSSTLKSAYESGAFPHPVTGEILTRDQFAEKIVVYFKPVTPCQNH